MAAVKHLLAYDDPPRLKFPLHLKAPSAEFWTEERCFITELINTSEDPDCSIARARVEPGVATRWHRLAGVTERYLILAGRGRAEIGDLAAQDVGPGDAILIPPGCRQRITNTGDTDLIFLAICTPRFQLSCYEDLGD